MAKKLLLVDNDLDFLESRVEKLRAEGYEVYQADSIEGAEYILERSWVHMAIVDVRMIDESDDKDTSGLLLAKKEAYIAIPKIILTKFPSYEYVREALGPALEGLPLAVDFLSKQEGPEAMLRAIARGFIKHVQINWDLRIVCLEPGNISFPHLIGLIEPKIEGAQLQNRVEELEDLYRKAFFDSEQITFSQLIWHKEGRAAVEVFSYSQQKETQFIVTCGPIAAIAAELRHYQENVPQTHSLTNTSLIRTAQTRHFAMIAWGLSSQGIIDGKSFVTFFRESADRKIITTLENFFNATLSPWHQQAHIVEEKNLAQLYLERLRITSEDLLPARFDSIVQALSIDALSRGLVDIKILPDQLEFHFPNGLKAAYPKLTFKLFEDKKFIYPRLICRNSLGRIDSNTFLIDQNGQAWVTDFAETGIAPGWQDFVSLETSVRFDLLDIDNMVVRYEFEKQLLSTNHLGEIIAPGDIEPDCRQVFNTIQTIRRLASQIAGDDLISYYLGLLSYTARTLISFDPSIRRLKREVVSWTHRLLIVSMLCGKIMRAAQGPTPESVQTKVASIQIDETNHEVRIGGRTVHLTPTEFTLLLYLHSHAGKLCTRQAIVRDVFKYANADRATERSLLNTNIERLRSKIEPDPSRPQYLFTIRGQGYKLVSNPAVS